MILFILLAIIIAKIRRHRIGVLLREPSLIPVWGIEIVFWLLQICIWRQDYRFIGYAGYLQTASILVLLWPIIKFRLYPQAIAGALMVSAGSIMNRSKGPLSRLKFNYYMWKQGENMNTVSAFFWTGVNLVFGALKRVVFKKTA